MASEIIKQQQRLTQTDPSFFNDEQRNVDAQIAQMQAADNQPIQVTPTSTGGERPSMTPVTPSSSEQQVPVQQRPVTAAERLQEFYRSVRPAKPVYDPTRIEEINRLKKNNSIAEGLKVLGDTFALAKNANVNRRPENTKNDRLTQAAWDYMDRYSQLMNDWNYKDYLAKMKGAESAAQQEWKDRNYNFNYRKYYDALKAKENQGKELTPYQEEYLKLQRDKLNWDKDKFGKELEQKAGDEAKTKENYVLYDGNGQRYPLDKNEEQHIAALIIEKGNIPQGDMDLLKASLRGSGSREQTGQLIQKYWERMPNVRKYMAKYGYLDQADDNAPEMGGFSWDDFLHPKSYNPNPTYQGEQASQNTPEQKQPEQKPQYSTGGYY